LGDDLRHIQTGVLAKRIGGGPHCFLIARSEGPQGMLDAVSQLPQNVVRNIQRILCDQENADALGTDEPYDLLDFVEQDFRRAFKLQVSLVEVENLLRFFRVAYLWKALEEFG
jgi:hypothetical protein